MTVVLSVSSSAASRAAAIAQAADILRRRGLVAFPTETVYGLGALALDAAAVAGIYAAKGRPATNPLIVHVASISAAQQLTTIWPAQAARLVERFWPGPLTLVLPRGAVVPEIVAAGGPTVAVRMPAHPIALALIEAVGAPLAAPSANASNRLSPTTADHVLRTLAGRVDLVLDGGATAGGIESTVIDLSRATPRLLRPGIIPRGELEAVLQQTVELPPSPGDARHALPSPGMLARHYAPLVRVELLPAAASTTRVAELLALGQRVGWLTIGIDEVRTLTAKNLVCLTLADDPRGYAAELYASLHVCEAAAVDVIIVDCPPDDEPWQAVLDRLRRASHPA